MANTLGYANPFRYRGYIFDDETWMYWLKNIYIIIDSVLGALHDGRLIYLK